jgi:tryptophanyl-tRNA synthetase
MEKNKQILTGHRPTGPRHIGHLVGTLNYWKQLQETHRCFFLIADLHVLTTDYSRTEQIQQNIIEVAADWIASGINPEKSTIILQSAIPEHALLSTLLSMLVTVNRLQRVPTFKEQVAQLNLKPSLGLLTYPVLQAADILLYRANYVPVGEDQLPHLEVTRELARRFNQLFGDTFPEPQALLSDQPRLPGIDNRTMHTSYGNAIYLRDTPETTRSKVMQMYTDPTRIRATDPGHIENNPVFVYLDVFSKDHAEVEEFKARYRAGRVGDVEIKARLADILNDALAPIRQRRKELIADPDQILEIIHSGTEIARLEAHSTMEQVKDAMGLLNRRNFS